jgi:sodium-dependent dicarboxylate transporter 2/3/5
VALHWLGVSNAEAWTIGIIVTTALIWILEALPMAVAALIPVAAFPVSGVLTYQKAASALGSHVIVLLMGSFMFALALERSGAHKKIARNIVATIGSGTKRLVFGFILAGALLSMWISNTAATLLLIPIALAVCTQDTSRILTARLVLGVAYACSVGGMATLIGTPPNLIFAALYSNLLGSDFGFLRWMQTGLVCVVIAVPLMSIWLTRGLRSEPVLEIQKGAAWNRRQIITLCIFFVTIVAWVTRSQPFGGWEGALGLPNVGDVTVILVAILVMFVFPAGDGEAILDWETAKTIPWGLLVLFAGGICIAYGFTESGLSDRLGSSLVIVSELPVFWRILLIVLIVSGLTEIMSSTATATLVLPVLGSAALASGLPPEQLMIPAALGASCSFMLPVATAPNAIAMSTGKVRMSDMVREGFALNVIVGFALAVGCWLTLT